MSVVRDCQIFRHFTDSTILHHQPKSVGRGFMLLKTNIIFLLMIGLIFGQEISYAQDKSGGGVTEEEVLVVDKDGDYIIATDPNKLIGKNIPLKGKYKRFAKVVDKFLSAASKELTDCRGHELKFTSLSEFRLFLVGTHAVHLVTTSSFLPTYNKNCNSSDTAEAVEAAKGTCLLSTPTVAQLKSIMNSRHFRNYLFIAEKATLNEAREAELYFKELFR